MSVLDTLTGLGVPLVVAPPKTGMIFQFSAAAGRLSLRIGTEAADAAPRRHRRSPADTPDERDCAGTGSRKSRLSGSYVIGLRTSPTDW